jgi:creatinine amidohydrolase
VGNPKKSTPEKGARFVNDVTDKIAGYFIELANCDLTDLYA